MKGDSKETDIVLVHSEGGTKGTGSLEVADRKGRRDTRQMSQRARMRALGLISCCLAAPMGGANWKKRTREAKRGEDAKTQGVGTGVCCRQGAKAQLVARGDPRSHLLNWSRLWCP